jgi:hypothetical protein
MRDSIADEGRKTVHEFWFGRGKEELKSVSNSSSVLQNHLLSLPNDRDGISVMAFFFPGMCSGVNGDTCFCFMRRLSARSSWSATLDPFAAILLTQLTVGELSLNSAQ